MPDHVTDSTDLKAQYAEQVAADLENNTKQQERIAADIAALQSQLTALERDHALLLTMQQTLTGAAPAARTAAKPRVPRARRSADGAPARRGGGTRSGRGRGAPTLREAIAGLLVERGGPCTVAEITAALAGRRPERPAGPNVVRNTLEALVAKGRADRVKQQKAVYYSAVTTGDGDAGGVEASDGAGDGGAVEASGAS